MSTFKSKLQDKENETIKITRLWNLVDADNFNWAKEDN